MMRPHHVLESSQQIAGRASRYHVSFCGTSIQFGFRRKTLSAFKIRLELVYAATGSGCWVTFHDTLSISSLLPRFSVYAFICHYCMSFNSICSLLQFAFYPVCCSWSACVLSLFFLFPSPTNHSRWLPLPEPEVCACACLQRID